jgi:hypothetical protein
MQVTSNLTGEIAIFGRIIQSDKGDLAPGLAKYILTLGFSEADQRRMSDLAERNQDGRLNDDEPVELASYVRASHLLALMQSKARKSLKRRRAS